jgi:hypothetical protein
MKTSSFAQPPLLRDLERNGNEPDSRTDVKRSTTEQSDIVSPMRGPAICDRRGDGTYVLCDCRTVRLRKFSPSAAATLERREWLFTYPSLTDPGAAISVRSIASEAEMKLDLDRLMTRFICFFGPSSFLLHIDHRSHIRRFQLSPALRPSTEAFL